jgi:hypothetical protein
MCSLPYPIFLPASFIMMWQLDWWYWWPMPLGATAVVQVDKSDAWGTMHLLTKTRTTFQLINQLDVLWDPKQSDLSKDQQEQPSTHMPNETQPLPMVCQDICVDVWSCTGHTHRHRAKLIFECIDEGVKITACKSARSSYKRMKEKMRWDAEGVIEDWLTEWLTPWAPSWHLWSDHHLQHLNQLMCEVSDGRDGRRNEMKWLGVTDVSSMQISL